MIWATKQTMKPVPGPFVMMRLGNLKAAPPASWWHRAGGCIMASMTESALMIEVYGAVQSGWWTLLALSTWTTSQVPDEESGMTERMFVSFFLFVLFECVSPD